MGRGEKPKDAGVMVRLGRLFVPDVRKATGRTDYEPRPGAMSGHAVRNLRKALRASGDPDKQGPVIRGVAARIVVATASLGSLWFFIRIFGADSLPGTLNAVAGAVALAALAATIILRSR